MGLRPTMASISKTDPRAVDWLHIYGALEVPIRSPVPVKAFGPDGGIHDFYHVAVEKLDEAAVGRAARFVAKKFNVPLDEVMRTMFEDDHGMPILAEGVYVSFDARLVL